MMDDVPEKRQRARSKVKESIVVVVVERGSGAIADDDTTQSTHTQ